MKPIGVLLAEFPDLVYYRVLKGQNRVIGSFIVCVFLLMYCLERELNHSFNKTTNTSSWTKAILLSIGFVVVNGFIIIQRLSNRLQFWKTPVKEMADTLVHIPICTLSHHAKNMHSKQASWGLSMFVIAYGVFYFLLMVNEAEGKNFGPTTTCILISLRIAFDINEDKISGAIIIMVTMMLVFFKIHHLDIIAERKKKSSKGMAVGIVAAEMEKSVAGKSD